MWNSVAKKFVEPTTNNGDELVMVTLDFMKHGQEFLYRVAVHNANSRVSEYITKRTDDVRAMFAALDCATSDWTLTNAWGLTG